MDALGKLSELEDECDLRLLVRDNGSSDGTARAVTEAFPNAFVDAGTENLGFARGMNILLARSDAPWFFPLNSDAWPERGCLTGLLRAAREHPDAAAVAPRLLRPDGSLEHSTHAFPSLGVSLMMATGAHRWLHRRAAKMMLEGEWDHHVPRAVDWAVGAALLMRREAIDDIGPFDENFFMYVEDLEWCWRARTRGWRIWFEPDAVVRHIGNVSGATRYGARRTAAYMANTYRFYREEHGPVATAVLKGLNVSGAARHYIKAVATRDRRERAYWRQMVPAYLGRGSPDAGGRG